MGHNMVLIYFYLIYLLIKYLKSIQDRKYKTDIDATQTYQIVTSSMSALYFLRQ